VKVSAFEVMVMVLELEKLLKASVFAVTAMA
jgi:hypothetical protein